MEKQGSLIFWSSEGVSTNEGAVIDAGLGDWVKKPQFRGYLRKAIDTVLRGYKTDTEKKTREYFSEGDGSYRYVVVDIRTSDAGVETDGASIYVDRLGRVSADATLEGTRMFEEIKGEYNRTVEAATLQGGDISAMIKDFVSGELIGFPLKKGGGVWIVDEKFRDQMDFLSNAARSLGVQFRSIDFHKDGNEISLSEVVRDGFSGEVEALLKDLLDTTAKIDREELTETQVYKRREKIEAARKRLEAHKDNLKGYFEDFVKRLNDIDKALEQADLSGAKKETFLELLGAL